MESDTPSEQFPASVTEFTGVTGAVAERIMEKVRVGTYYALPGVEWKLTQKKDDIIDAIVFRLTGQMVAFEIPDSEEVVIEDPDKSYQMVPADWWSHFKLAHWSWLGQIPWISPPKYRDIPVISNRCKTIKKYYYYLNPFRSAYEQVYPSHRDRSCEADCPCSQQR